MSYRPTKDALRNLTALAQRQGGYFSAKQAASAGYDYSHLDYHVRSGNFERSGRGFYRLLTSPPAEHDDLIRLAFWSRNRADQTQAVASHQTALNLHQLSDLLPASIHLTVPPGFRKPAPPGVVLHRGKLGPEETEEREGLLVTAPLRTLLDIATDERISQEHLGKAIHDAIERGLVRKSALIAAARMLRAGNRLLLALHGVS